MPTPDFAPLLDALSLPSAVITREWTFLAANPAFGQVLGQASGSLSGRSLLELLTAQMDGEALASLRAGLAQVESTGEPLSLPSMTFWTGDATASSVRARRGFSLAPVKVSGEPGLFLVQITSLGDQSAELEQERQARQQAQEANQRKDEFLSTLSHELRTPLNAMMGWTRILRTTSLPEEKRTRALETIERNARLQLALIEDVLDVSRMLNGRLRLEVADGAINPVVEAAAEASRPSAEARGVQLSVLLPPEPVFARLDADRLQQALAHLLSNAVKFTPRGGSVEVRLERSGDEAVIALRDTGTGIPAEVLPRLFDRLSSSAAPRTSGGLGLGLVLSKHLIELHGGSLQAESPGAGQGSTFTVRLPVELGAARSSQPASGESTARIAGLHILVVDDEPDAREMLRSLLEHDQARVTVAGSASEARARLADSVPDIIVSDIGMPDEDGYTFLRQVRALPADKGGRTPAIALTAFTRPEDRQRALQAGFSHHAAKPVEPDELIATIASLAQRPSLAS